MFQIESPRDTIGGGNEPACILKLYLKLRFGVCSWSHTDALRSLHSVNISDKINSIMPEEGCAPGPKRKGSNLF